MNERRRFHRIDVGRKGILSGPEFEEPVVVEDVSLKGALLRVPPGTPLDEGGPLKLRIELSPDAVIEMALSLAHRDDNTAGFRCAEIDMESIAHLKRLVELNLGDSEALNRELQELAGG